MKWSNTVEDYYDVHPKPRWGFGKPPHPELKGIIESRRVIYEHILSQMSKYRELLHKVPHSKLDGSETLPFWHNNWFSALDAASLMYFISERRPRNYIEIGSGFSTMFARFAIRDQGLHTQITSIDPQPRASINELCDKVVRSSLEDCDTQLFSTLSAGDILFFDGSHRVFQNSDVTTFFLEVIPRLKPGVLVHIHDIFLPEDYMERWLGRLYTEQYILAAMLLSGGVRFKILLPNYFVCRDPKLSLLVQKIFKSPTSGSDIPLFYKNWGDLPGVSFWIETFDEI